MDTGGNSKNLHKGLGRSAIVLYYAPHIIKMTNLILPKPIKRQNSETLNLFEEVLTKFKVMNSLDGNTASSQKIKQCCDDFISTHPEFKDHEYEYLYALSYLFHCSIHLKDTAIIHPQISLSKTLTAVFCEN